MKIVVMEQPQPDPALTSRVAVIVPEEDLWTLRLIAARSGINVLKIEDEGEAVERVTAQLAGQGA